MGNMSFRPDDEDAFFRRRDDLIDQFSAWLSSRPKEIAGRDLSLLLDYKWGYGDGRLGSWTRDDVSDFLLSWCPRKLSFSLADAQPLPEMVAAAMSFFADRGLLSKDSERVERLVEHALGLQEQFLAKMSDPANFGMAKSIFGHLAIDDPTSLSAEDLDRAVDQFNALPMEERRSVTDSAVRSPGPPPVRLGPVQLPTADAVRASADSSPVLNGFSVLADFCAAPGRRLTAKGNLTLADARSLVELLGTRDVYEEEVGERVFRKHSATQFVELDHWQWWARESGALRRVGQRLVGVKAWQQRRAKDPIGELQRAVRVLLSFGALESYLPRHFDDLDSLVDESVGPLLGRLIQAPGGVDYDDLLQEWTAMSERIGQPEPYPGALTRYLHQLLTLLERSGVVSQDGAVFTPGMYGSTVRTGGTLRLTPFGNAVAVDVLEEEGVIVDVLPNAHELEAADVAGLFDLLEPTEWWTTASSWIDLQDEVSAAVSELVGRLADLSLGRLILALGAAPEGEWDRLAVTLRELSISDPPPGDIGSVAMHWLLQRGKLDETAVDPDQLLDCTLVTLGAIAEADGSFVAEVVAEGHTVSEQLEIIGGAGRRMLPRVVTLLEAIGAESTDKVVAKAARKELFRVRSKLVSQQQRQS